MEYGLTMIKAYAEMIRDFNNDKEKQLLINEYNRLVKKL